MAIKGPFNYRGITIPEAYARVVSIHSPHKENRFSFQIIVYTTPNNANIGIDNTHYQLHHQIFTDVMQYDYSVPLQTAAYLYLKTLDEFKTWSDC
jgi:hypothetical protein